MKKRLAQKEKNGNDDDKHDNNESDDIDEIACGSMDEAGPWRRPRW